MDRYLALAQLVSNVVVSSILEFYPYSLDEFDTFCDPLSPTGRVIDSSLAKQPVAK